jgi:hypothetical protein
MGLAAAVCGPAMARGQCVSWAGKNGGVGVSHAGFAATAWDPDGAGPQQPQVIVGGDLWFAGAVGVNKVARWDGASWSAMGAGVSYDVYALASWDPDGAGPQPPQLISAGRYQFGNGSLSSVMRWTGTAWQSLGTGTDNAVYALTTWDPDGDGPQNPLLVAAGVFGTAGGVTVNRIAAWDGAAWHALGTGMDGWAESISDVTSWDPDGPGPLPPRLVAAGYFTVAGGVTVKNIAQWDGVAWSPLGAGLGVGADYHVEHVTTWDPDGAGPLPERLVASGYFFASGERAVERLAWWDGTLWQPMFAGLNVVPNVIGSWDADGPGPEAAVLLAGGGQLDGTGNELKSWNGTAWVALGASTTGNAHALTVWDPDGSGPQRSQPVLTGSFESIGAVRVDNAARWDGSQWQPMGLGTNGTIVSLAQWDPDGAGPAAARMVAAGDLTALGGTVTNRVSNWNGSAWEPMSSGMNGGVGTLVSWDPDGPGAAAPLLVAGGAFSAAGGVPATGIAKWDGAAWSAFGAGIDPGVTAVTTWDPDGNGPQAPWLVAAETRHFVGADLLQRVFRWDGSSWQVMGASFPSTLLRLAHVDPDGDGPAGDELYASIAASSQFGTGGVVVRWNGSAWVQVGDQFVGNIKAMTAWDPDGSGPLPARLLIAGDFTRLYGGLILNRVAQLEGGAWGPVGAGFNNAVTSVALWDMDGDGPLPPALVAAGSFTSSGGVSCRYLARWDAGASGGTWVQLRSDAAQSMGAMAELRPAAGVGELFVSGEGARLVSGGAAPLIVAQPVDARACGGGASFSAHAVNTETPAARWQVQNPNLATAWIDVSNGPLLVLGQTVGVASGADTEHLTLSGVVFPSLVDAMRFRLRAGVACGDSYSAPALLRYEPGDVGVAGGGPGHDGVRNNNDFVAFIDAFFGGEYTADVGTVGGVPGSDQVFDNNDFVVFIDQFFAGCGG